MMCVRRFWKPTGLVDVPALAAGVVFLVAVAVVVKGFSREWTGLFPAASWIVPTLLVSVPFWTPDGRRMAWFFWWSLARAWSRPREALAEIVDSEAERHVRADEDDESELNASAWYVVRLATDEGDCFDCELPMKRWARLRVGMTVQVGWQGGWVTRIEEAAGPTVE